MSCLLIIGLSNMKPFTKTALSSRVVSNVVKVTLTPLMMIRLWYIGPFHFSILFCEIIIIGTSTRCASYPCQSTYTQHRDGSMQTRRASWTGSPNLSKDARGMAKRGKDWRNISIVRRRPFSVTPDCLSAYENVSVKKKQMKGIGTHELSGTLFTGSKSISTLRMWRDTMI